MGEIRHKFTRLRYYDYSKCGAYFVTICTENRANLFGQLSSSVEAHPCVRPNEAHRMVEKWLLKLQERFENVILDYYVIIPDHIHFVLLLPGTNSGAHMGAPLQEKTKAGVSLYDVIKWFKTQTTNEYIRSVKQGKFPKFNKRIWQRGYYDHIIRSRDELCETRKYMRDNPARRYYETTNPV